LEEMTLPYLRKEHEEVIAMVLPKYTEDCTHNQIERVLIRPAVGLIGWAYLITPAHQTYPRAVRDKTIKQSERSKGITATGRGVLIRRGSHILQDNRLTDGGWKN
jgi:hypothetical protein